jgi:hypothetical protein
MSKRDCKHEKEPQKRLPECIQIFYFQSQTDLYVVFVFPFQIQNGIHIALQILGLHFDGAHESAGIYLRRVVRKAENLETCVYSVFHIFPLCAVRMVASPGVGVIVCDHFHVYSCSCGRFVRRHNPILSQITPEWSPLYYASCAAFSWFSLILR